jgi:drug/metabolite transporter (DMT)-like permease
VQWRSGLVTGTLMLCGGTGGVILAIRHVDSGLVALLVGMVPLWIAFLMWFWPGGKTPSLGVVGALLIGFLGVAILAAPSHVLGGAPVHLPSVLITMLACIFWGFGSLYSRSVDLPRSPQLVSAIQMLGGGAALIVWGWLAGEWRGFELQAVSWSSVLAFFYLIVFGSLIAFSAYSWLIRNTEPTLVSTYAYVNPVVAVFLGWLLAGEPIGVRTVLAAVLIVTSVVLVTTAGARRRSKRAAPVATVPTQPTAVLRYDPGAESPLGKKCA